MDTDSSLVDTLTLALSAAGMLRSSGDAERGLASAYAALGREPPDPSAPLAVRIVQLILDAGPDRGRLHRYLRRIEGPLSWDRRPARSDEPVELVPQDPAAQRYVQMFENDQLGPGHSMFWRADAYPYLPSFRILERGLAHWFYGPTVVTRDGRELAPGKAGPPQTGDKWNCRALDLPQKVKGLIDYPFEIATLFEIEAGVGPFWDVWDICCAFSDQYMRLYERPERYGIWGADLSSLWIENLIYYPDHELIYPEVGS